MLAFNADGSLASADGIPIDKLQQILEALQNGTLEFDDIQSYLQTMSTLIANGNLTESQQLTVLKNIKDFAEEQNNDIAAINANIAAIAKVFEAEAEIELDTDFNIDTPDVIIDKFPFCLPFDIHRLFNLLSATPKAPKISVPIKIKEIAGYSINQDFSFEVDLSDYETVASIIRWLLYFTFIIGLVLATNKLIGRG